MSLASQNKNPLCVKQVAGGWKGSIGVDAQGHAVFGETADGIRAGTRCIQQRWLTGRTTIRLLIGPAPGMGHGKPWTAKIGDIEGYIRAVATYMQILADKKLKLFLPDGYCNLPWIPTLINLEEAMAEVESGHDFCPPLSDWLDGIVRFQRNFPEAGR